MRTDSLALASIAFCTATCNAFLSPSMTRSLRLTSSDHRGLMYSGEDSNNEDHFDVEAVRKRLEAMMGMEAMMGGEEGPNENPFQDWNSYQAFHGLPTRPSSQAHHSMPPSPSGGSLYERFKNHIHPAVHEHVQHNVPASPHNSPSSPPPLTTIARERKVAEIQLLANLGFSDDSMSDLFSLWFAERGAKAAAELVYAEDITTEPENWAEAEGRLRKLIDEHGVHWVEPVNRLATLMFSQGRLEESKALCETVLAVKPWHFGAVSGMVLVCDAMGDVDGARHWASRRLPPIDGNNRERAEWVERSIEVAREALDRAEEQVRHDFGAPDVRPPRQDPPPEDEGDAWQ